MAIFNKIETENNFDIPVYEGYDAEVNGNMDAFMENFDDELAIIEAMHDLDISEMQSMAKIKALKESDEPDEDEIEDAEKELDNVMEASLQNIWDNIISALKKLWGKIKAFFAAVLKFFDGIFMSAKGFADKYEKQLLELEKSGKLKGYKFKMFEYDLDVKEEGKISNTKVANAANKIMGISKNSEAEVEAAIKAIRDGNEEELNKTRAQFVTGKTSVPAGEFQKELFKRFRKGAEKEEDKKEISVSIKTTFDTLKATQAKVGAVKQMQSDTDTNFNKIISSIKRIGNDMKNESETKKIGGLVAQYTKLAVSQTNSILAIHNTFINAWKSAVNEQLNVCKSICVGAFRHKAEK